MIPQPDPRTIQRALGVLERLPHEALADLAERLIDRLDVAGPDPDLEPEEDCCNACEDGGLPMPGASCRATSTTRSPTTRSAPARTSPTSGRCGPSGTGWSPSSGSRW